MRRRPWILCLTTALTLTLTLGLTLGGAHATSSDDEAAYRVERAIWLARFDEARARVTAAHARQQRALDSYTHMRHRRRVRGPGKLAVKNELTAAALEVDAADSNLESLHDSARRTGIPKGWSRERDGDVPAAPADGL